MNALASFVFSLNRHSRAVRAYQAARKHPRALPQDHQVRLADVWFWAAQCRTHAYTLSRARVSVPSRQIPVCQHDGNGGSVITLNGKVVCSRSKVSAPWFHADGTKLGRHGQTAMLRAVANPRPMFPSPLTHNV